MPSMYDNVMLHERLLREHLQVQICEALNYLVEEEAALLRFVKAAASAYVSIRQHTSASVSIRQHTSAYVRIRQHASAYISILSTRRGEVDELLVYEALSYKCMRP